MSVPLSPHPGQYLVSFVLLILAILAGASRANNYLILYVKPLKYIILKYNYKVMRILKDITVTVQERLSNGHVYVRTKYIEENECN